MIYNLELLLMLKLAKFFLYLILTYYPPFYKDKYALKELIKDYLEMFFWCLRNT